MRNLGLGMAALAVLGLGVPEAGACGWLWPCAHRPYASRGVPSTHGYVGHTVPRRAHRHRGAWTYGYAPRSTAVRPRPWQPRTALPAANTDAVGLTPPVLTAQGLLNSALPAAGPTLFGPDPPYGYYYGGRYGQPAYGYYPPGTPPPGTPSWWIEPRRRR